MLAAASCLGEDEGRAGRPLAGMRSVGFLEALARAGCAATAVRGHAKIALQILHRAGAGGGGLMNLAFGDGLAYTDVHGALKAVICE